MTQSQRIFARIEGQGYITNRDFCEMGLSHIGRNRLTEAQGKAYFAAKGLKVVYQGAENFLDHKWVLEPIQEAQGELFMEAV